MSLPLLAQTVLKTDTDCTGDIECVQAQNILPLVSKVGGNVFIIK